MITNAARLLKQSNVTFDLLNYDVDLNDLSAGAVANKIGRPAEDIYKTLVLVDDRGHHAFVVLSGAEELSLKAIAKAIGTKKVQLVPMKDLEKLTGYIRGGVSPIGAKRAFPVYLSDTAETKQTIIISAGKRGSQLVLAPQDLLAFTKGKVFSNC